MVKYKQGTDKNPVIAIHGGGMYHTGGTNRSQQSGEGDLEGLHNAQAQLSASATIRARSRRGATRSPLDGPCQLLPLPRYSRS